jgi:CRISPR/Cas system CSM-associated protein Csm3 (group 7 of RAMP superfamily)
MTMQAQWQKDRGLAQRIQIRGTLVLETPTHLGNGDVDGPLDMPIHVDPLEGRPLLTGASLAGALRNYVYLYVSPEMADKLFGYVTNRESIESWVIIDDALANEPPNTELRDGVSIDPKTRTAEDKKKFDIELLAAGTTFPIRLELNLPKDEETANALKQSLAWGLKALERGDIRLGKRKRRGFGKVKVKAWQVDVFDMTTLSGLQAWLQTPVEVLSPEREDDLFAKLLVADDIQPDIAELTATFRVDGSLLIRSAVGDAAGPDFEHLKSSRPGNGMTPVLSGTSVAGAMRARALRIANTLGMDGEAIINELFGAPLEKNAEGKSIAASRIWVEETEITQPLELVHTRVAIDRFTGGAYPGALFSEQPVFGQENTRVEIKCWIPKPKDWEIGLLLLLLKDLWTGDLPLGGEASVGRGRLRGMEATLTVREKSWTIEQAPQGGLKMGDDTAMDWQAFLDAFLNKEKVS